MSNKSNEDVCVFQQAEIFDEADGIIREVRIPKALVAVMDKTFTRKSTELGWWISYPAPTPIIVDIGVGFNNENEAVFQARVQAAKDVYSRITIFEVKSTSLTQVVGEALRKCSEEILRQADTVQAYIERDKQAITEYSITKGETNHEN